MFSHLVETCHSVIFIIQNLRKKIMSKLVVQLFVKFLIVYETDIIFFDVKLEENLIVHNDN
jgi:hypothetical protein